MKKQYPFIKVQKALYNYSGKIFTEKTLKRLIGGLRNDVFYESELNVVIKVFQEKRNFYGLFDFDVEITAMNVLNNLQCKIPRLYHVDYELKVIVIEYLDGKNLLNKNYSNSDIANLIFDTHNKVKNVIRGFIEPNIEDYFIDGIKKISMNNYNAKNNIPNQINVFYEHKKKQLILGSVALHNIISTEKGLYHIDFERSVISYPSFDFAHLFSFNKLSNSDKIEIIKQYCRNNINIDYEDFFTECQLSEILVSILHIGIFMEDLNDFELNSTKKMTIIQRLDVMKDNLFDKRDCKNLIGVLANEALKYL
jgi:thiamine kinase-like enzyme